MIHRNYLILNFAEVVIALFDLIKQKRACCFDPPNHTKLMITYLWRWISSNLYRIDLCNLDQNNNCSKK